MRWNDGATRAPGPRAAAVSFYLALMTAEGLDLIGAEGPATVEGPLGRDPDYLAMLSAALRRPVRGGAGSATGTSFGAALLADPTAPLPSVPPARLEERHEWRGYAATWRAAVRRG